MLSTGVTGDFRRPARPSDPGVGAHAFRFPEASRIRGSGPLPRGVPVFHTSDQGDCFMQQKTETSNPLETDPALSAEIPPDHRNEVVLAGRITAVPVIRHMPSGDQLATWRICVARSATSNFRGRRVDSVTCASFDRDVHRALEGWRLGDVIEVRGALRRRTWWGREGFRSVCEVEAGSVAFVRSRRKAVR